MLRLQQTIPHNLAVKVVATDAYAIGTLYVDSIFIASRNDGVIRGSDAIITTERRMTGIEIAAKSFRRKMHWASEYSAVNLATDFGFEALLEMQRNHRNELFD